MKIKIILSIMVVIGVAFAAIFQNRIQFTLPLTHSI